MLQLIGLIKAKCVSVCAQLGFKLSPTCVIYILRVTLRRKLCSWKGSTIYLCKNLPYNNPRDTKIKIKKIEKVENYLVLKAKK